MSERSELISVFENTLDQIEAQAQTDIKLHEVESTLLKQILALGLKLLGYYLNQVYQNTFYPNSFFIDGENGKKEKYINKGKSTINYQSIFGLVSIGRTRYYSESQKQSIFPIDKKLGISKNGISYALQNWLSESSCKLVYEQSVKLLNKILNLSLKGMQVFRINDSVHKEVSNFYEEKKVEKIIDLSSDQNNWACVSFDGKGIPIRAKEVDRNIESSGERLGRGQKRGTKKEVTVSVNYMSTKRVRTPDDVINSFFSAESKEKQINRSTKDPTRKHYRGFLCNQKQAIKYGLKRSSETIAENQKIVVLIDGCRGLEKAVEEHSHELDIEDKIEAKILDFVHVTEYVWKVANAILGEKSTERSSWVKNCCLTILNGNAESLAKEWENYLLVNLKISEGRKRSIQSAITYFQNHLHMMQYNEYLEKGMPISTGVVESACGHFIQQRFDTNGMRWTLKGAQTLIDLKAICINDDWDEMFNLFIEKEQQQLFSNFPKVAA